MFCAVSASKVYRPFFLAKRTVTGVVYLDMLQQWLMPRLQKDKVHFILKQDGALAHFLCDYLNAELSDGWIGRASRDHNSLLLWPPRSHGLTPCNFF